MVGACSGPVLAVADCLNERLHRVAGVRGAATPATRSPGPKPDGLAFDAPRTLSRWRGSRLQARMRRLHDDVVFDGGGERSADACGARGGDVNRPDTRRARPGDTRAVDMPTRRAHRQVAPAYCVRRSPACADVTLLVADGNRYALFAQPIRQRGAVRAERVALAFRRHRCDDVSLQRRPVRLRRGCGSDALPRAERREPSARRGRCGHEAVARLLWRMLRRQVDTAAAREQRHRA